MKTNEPSRSHLVTSVAGSFTETFSSPDQQQVDEAKRKVEADTKAAKFRALTEARRKVQAEYEVEAKSKADKDVAVATAEKKKQLLQLLLKKRKQPLLP